MVSSSAMPFICMAPSPVSAIAGRSGWANLAPIAYGTAAPMVARPPDSDPRTSPRMRRCRAYQLATEPESAVTIASSGSRSESSQTIRMGLTGLASSRGRRPIARQQSLALNRAPPVPDVLLDLLPPGAIGRARQHGQEPLQGRARVAEQVHLRRVTHPGHGAGQGDLHGSGLPELGKELAVRETRADDEQGVAALHQLVARAGAEQADRPR